MRGAVALLSLGFLGLLHHLQFVSGDPLSDLLKLSAAKPLIDLRDSNYDALVRSRHRSYHMFVLFTARDRRYQCSLCGAFESELEVVASSWQQQQATHPDTQIFFAVADIATCGQTFKQYELKQAPILVHFGPTEETAHPDSTFPRNGQYNSELDAENVALFVRDKTDVFIRVQRANVIKVILLLISLCCFVITLMLTGNKVMDFFLSIRQNTLLWFGACVAIYFISVSGFLYDIIRGVAPLGYDSKAQRFVFVAPSGTQYGIEGFLIGAMHVGAAACIIFLTTICPKLRNAELRNYAAGTTSVLFLFFFYQVYSLYSYKNPWYSVRNMIF